MWWVEQLLIYLIRRPQLKLPLNFLTSIRQCLIQLVCNGGIFIVDTRQNTNQLLYSLLLKYLLLVLLSIHLNYKTIKLQVTLPVVLFTFVYIQFCFLNNQFNHSDPLLYLSNTNYSTLSKWNAR